MFCIKSVQYMARVQVSLRCHRELAGEVVLSHGTNGTCSYVQARQILCDTGQKLQQPLPRLLL